MSKLVMYSVVLSFVVTYYAALAQTPDEETPAEEVVCDGEVGAAFGLCNAFCEAMDCDSDSPRASEQACDRVAATFTKLTGRDRLPCEQSMCPCEYSRVERSAANWSPAGDTELFAIGTSCGSEPPLDREVTLIHRTTLSVPSARLRVIDTNSARGIICEVSDSTGLLGQGEFLSGEQYTECRRDILDYAQLLKVAGLLGMDDGQCAGSP